MNLSTWKSAFQKRSWAFMGAALGSLLAFSATAQASTIYQFTSATYQDAQAPYTTAMRLTINITLTGPLAVSSTTNKVFSLAGFSYTWNDGLHSYSGASAGNFLQTLNLTTNSQGNITGWDFSFGNNDAEAVGNNVSSSALVQVVDFASNASAGLSTGNGTWVTVQTAAAIPEPKSYGLVLGGVLALFATGMRFRSGRTPASEMR